MVFLFKGIQTTSYTYLNYMETSSNIVIGVDNGVTGTVGIISSAGYWLYETPTSKAQDYTKTKKNITRINSNELRKLLLAHIPDDINQRHNVYVVLERPMVNPTRWAASGSALRALESTLVVLESLGLRYEFVDSKEWQKKLLPKGTEKEGLKTASVDVGVRLFPSCADLIRKHKDADGLLIAEWAKRER